MNTQPELRSILYVEDDPQLRMLGRMALEIIGRFTVRECASGRPALAAAADFRPDLILLDARSPELDGMGTLGLLRRFPHLAATPVMFITERDAGGTALRYAEAGAIALIERPVRPMGLAGQLRSLWEERPLLRAAAQLGA